jgi:hypothetical protein
VLVLYLRRFVRLKRCLDLVSSAAAGGGRDAMTTLFLNRRHLIITGVVVCCNTVIAQRETKFSLSILKGVARCWFLKSIMLFGLVSCEGQTRRWIKKKSEPQSGNGSCQIQILFCCQYLLGQQVVVMASASIGDD